MSSSEIVLVRHGRTEANASRRIVGNLDVPLDEVGLGQAQALAASWPFGAFTAVYASPLTRARQTAAALSAVVTIVDDLREMHQGDLEGLDAVDAYARFGPLMDAWRRDPTGVRLPGGESLDEVQGRAWEALSGIAEAHPGERVVVVSHQLVIASVAARAAGERLAAWRRHAVDNTGVRRLRWDDGALRLVEEAHGG